MDATRPTENVRDSATVELRGDREIVVTRTVRGPVGLVFDAWTKAELLAQWWTPKSFPIRLLSCETDPRVGGTYRLTFAYEDSTFAFFGRYVEVTPNSRLVWTNEEDEENGTLTTVTLESVGDSTRVSVHDLYPSPDARAAALASSSTSGMPESLAQLDEFMAAGA